MIGAKLIEAAGNGISTVAVAEAIDFDGTNDYLSRSSLVGNSDGKQFTCSAFFYIDPEVNDYKTVIAVNFRVQFRINLDGGWYFTCKNAAGTNVLDVYRSGAETYLPVRTWVHFLISIDLTDSAKRSIYVNDILMTGQSWATYTNDNIAWTYGTFFVGANSTGLADPMDGRLSNVYLDYTYRDLSVTNNRRLFVTADLKPAADQATLNPILYLPMSDPTQPGLNAGTGGNFTLTGTVARSGRGPNQYNAPYSTFDGVADYLNRTSITGLADGASFTVSFSYSPTVQSTDRIIIGNDSQYFNVWFNAGLLRVQGKTSAGATLLLALVTAPTLVVGRNYTITISIDLSSASNRAIYINGESATVTWSTYTNGNIDFTRAFGVGANNSAGDKIQGNLGALWFNTSYIDLSVASNLAKFVTGTGIDAKPVDLGANGELPTGTSPLIYLPMYGNNAGKNYGTGGDFTVNSGPYTGARGPNEFWGNLAGFDGTTGYLLKSTALNGISNSKTFSLSFNVQFLVGATSLTWISNSDNVNTFFVIQRRNTNTLRITAKNAAGSTILHVDTASTLFQGSNRNYVQMCIDLSDTSKRFVYVNGVLDSSTWTTYTNDTAAFNLSHFMIGGFYVSSSPTIQFNGRLSEFYFTTDYIDFSQEANRLKFRDAFGNPVDLTQQIEDAAIPNPAIYMRFPPTSFGTNSGTGGDFTVNGTITDGGQL